MTQVLGDRRSGLVGCHVDGGPANGGLGLRSPAHHADAAARLIHLFDQRGAPTPAADAVARAYIDAQAYQLHTYWTASKVARGEPAGPEASCNEIFRSGDRRGHSRDRPGTPGIRRRTARSRVSRRMAGRLPHGAGRAHRRSDERRCSATSWPNACSASGTVDRGLLVQRRPTRAASERAPGRWAASSRSPLCARTARPRRHNDRLMAAGRWAALAALGAPGMLVPEPDDGLGLSDVDLVGVFEEAGWSALPEPLLETAGLAAPLLAALLPAPAAADALRALLKGNAPLAVGGIDIGPAGPSSPTTVSADGMLRTPRVVGARDAAIFLLAVRDPDSGWQLHAVPSGACTTHATPALDPTRDLAVVHWPLSAETLLAYGVAAEASVGLHGRSRRSRLCRALERAGRSDDHVGRRRRQGASPVRRSRRELRGREAPPGRRQGQARIVTPGDVSRRLGSRRPHSRRCPMTRRWPKPWRRMSPTMAARVALQVYGALGSTWQCDLHFFVQTGMGALQGLG